MRMRARIVRGRRRGGDNDGLLEVGETWSYTATHTVTQAEIDSNGGGDGDIDNTATADSDQTGPDTAEAAVPMTQAPALNITKAVHDVDGDTDALRWRIAAGRRDQLHDHGCEHRQPDADRGYGDRSECGRGLDRARRRRGR